MLRGSAREDRRGSGKGKENWGTGRSFYCQGGMQGVVLCIERFEHFYFSAICLRGLRVRRKATTELRVRVCVCVCPWSRGRRSETRHGAQLLTCDEMCVDEQALRDEEEASKPSEQTKSAPLPAPPLFFCFCGLVSLLPFVDLRIYMSARRTSLIVNGRASNGHIIVMRPHAVRVFGFSNIRQSTSSRSRRYTD